MKRKKRHPLPKSDDSLVDWHFRQIVYYLKNKVNAILVTAQPLIDPHDDISGVLCGYIDFHPRGRATILINGATDKHSNRETMGKTLVHEAAHGFLDTNVHEKDILRLENLLWKLFTKEQRKMIISYLPKHKAKRGSETA